mmetsp:Transcript_101202/g.241298  ORF Transcript_101202/g.241298 Transcript_101202/m.241298 type:complete len:306 (-) Transcript_101202:1267-2184(-)
MARQPPGQKEGLPDVLVWIAEELVDAGVNHGCNSVDEDHDLILKNFGGICEVADVAEAKNRLNSAPWDHGIQSRAVAAAHVLANDLSARLSKAQCQQGPDLDDGLFQNHGLHGLRDGLRRRTPAPDALPHRQEPPNAQTLALALRFRISVFSLLAALEGSHLLPVMLLVANGHGFKRIVSDLVELRDHSLDGCQNQPVCILRKGHGSEAQQETDEDRLRRVQNRLQLRAGPAVEDEHEVDLFILRGGRGGWHHDRPLVVAQLRRAVKIGVCCCQQRHPLDVAIDARRRVVVGDEEQTGGVGGHVP